MKKLCACMVLSIFAATPVLAEDDEWRHSAGPPVCAVGAIPADILEAHSSMEAISEMESADSLALWKHKFGISYGGVGEFGEVRSVYYENHVDGRWSIRPAIEYARGSHIYTDPNGGYREMEGKRLGLAFDCLCYMSEDRQNGTGPYLLAGIGLHKTDMMNESMYVGSGIGYTEHSGIAPALSLGLGWYFNRGFGIEYKRNFFALNPPFPEGVGKNWSQYSMNLRFSGQVEAKEATKRRFTPEEPSYRHKVGLRLGIEERSFFYEHQFSGHWAVRGSLESGTVFEGYESSETNAGSGYRLEVDVDHKGVAADCIYYVFRHKHSGTGLYLLAGLGYHDIRLIGHGARWNNVQMADSVPSLAWGFGFYFGRYFGVEGKVTRSTLSSPFPADIGKEWGQIGFHFRFPLPVPAKDSRST
jgi:hypothetical protein